MKKIIFTSLLIFSIPIMLMGCSKDKVIIESKAGEIHKEEFHNKMEETVGDYVLKQMILEKLLENKYKVSEKELNETIDDFKKEQGIESEEDLKTLLKEKKVTYDLFKKEMKFNTLLKKAMLDDIENLDKLKKELFEQQKTQAKVSHILVDSEEKAKEILEQLKKDSSEENFVKLAKLYSIDHTSAQSGGDLGFLSQSNALDETFKKAAFSLKKDELSEVVQSQFGYHIIKITETKALSLKELEPSIEKQILENHAPNVMELYDILSKEYDIQVKDEKYETFIKSELPTDEQKEDESNTKDSK